MQTYGVSDTDNQKEYGALYQQAQQEGVTLYGPLAKREMIAILEESRVFAYPNTFAETFCIAALEAQAAGLPVVTTELAGLKERVAHGTDGFLVSGHPADVHYKNDFIHYVVRCLTNDSLWDTLSHAAYKKALTYDYASLAKTWEDYFSKQLEKAEVSQPYLFLPHDEKLSLIIGGYAKQIELKKEFLCRSYAKCLYDTGYHQTAKQVLNGLEE